MAAHNEFIPTLRADVDRDRLIMLTKQMVAIPSVNDPHIGDSGPVEAAMARYFAADLESLGFEVLVDDVSPGRPNVVARWSGPRPGKTILLAGHLDTVGIDGYFDPFEGKEHSGRVYGRGSCDMKGGLAAILEAARLVVTSGHSLGGDLLVVGTADEEDQMIGSTALGAAGPVADMAIVAEPTSLAICPAHKGQLTVNVRTIGKAVHSSVPNEGINAVAQMGKVLRALEEYAARLSDRPGHELCGTATVSAVVITGGMNVSQVPDTCELAIDRRSLPGESIKSVHAECESILAGLAMDDPTFRYEISPPTMVSASLSTDLDHPLVAALVAAVGDQRGPASVTGFTGGTDAPGFGCPAVICGPGALAQAHSLDEYVEVEEIESAAVIYAAAVLDLLGASAGVRHG